MSKTLVTEPEQLEKALQGNNAALCYFTAPWCGPCQTMGPMVASIANEFAGRIPVLVVDISELPEVAAQHNIRSVPAFMAFVGGRVWDCYIGSRSLADLQGLMNAALAAGKGGAT